MSIPKNAQEKQKTGQQRNLNRQNSQIVLQEMR